MAKQKAKSKSRSTTKSKTPKTKTPKTKATSKTQRGGRKTATSKGTKTASTKSTPTAKKTPKTTPKTTKTTSKAKTPVSPELPGGMSTITTPAPRKRVYSATVGFRSKVWGLLYGQRSNGGKVEVCVQDGMTMPEATKARTLMDSQDSIEWVRVIAIPTEKQLRG